MSDRPFDIQVGLLLEENLDIPDISADSDEHGEAMGRHRQATGRRNRVVELGEDALRAAAHAIGSEIAVVVTGVVRGIDSPAGLRGNADADKVYESASGSLALDTGSFSIDSVELTFGVKASVGVGPAVTALLTAGGEADVEVKLTLSLRDR